MTRQPNGAAVVRPAALVDLALVGLEEAMHSRGHPKTLIDQIAAQARDHANARLADEPAQAAEKSIQRAYQVVAPFFTSLMRRHGLPNETLIEVNEDGRKHVARVRRYREIEAESADRLTEAKADGCDGTTER